MLNTLRKLSVFLDRRMKRRWLMLIPLSVIGAAMEACGAFAIFILIGLVSNKQQLPLMGMVNRIFGQHDEGTVLMVFSVGVAIFFVCKIAFHLCEVYARECCASACVVSISTRSLGRYLAAPYAYHLRRHSADLIRNTMTSAVTVSRTVLYSLTTVVSEVLVVTAILVVLVTKMWGATLIIAAVVALVMGGLLWLTQRRFSRWGAIVHRLTAAMLKHLQQSLTGVKEVKVLGRQDYFVSSFRRISRSLRTIEARQGTFAFVPRYTVESLFVIGVVVMVLISQMRGAGGQSLVQAIGFFAYAGLRVLPSLHLIVYRLNRAKLGAAAIEELYRDWNELPEPALPISLEAHVDRLAFNDRIEIDNLSFTYERGDRPALDDVHMTIRRGQSVGIVGSTGAGKTTLVDLLLGLLEPTSGRIAVDGIDIGGQAASWQRQIGYVPQATYLMDDTIRRNIALGLDDKQIDNNRVRAAIEMAQLDTFIDSLPDGVDTLVGERGTRLSGGQSQRVAIARALYHDPQVLIFDEATAALDNRTERELMAAIESLHGQKTIIIIAHRLSTVQSCDQMIYLDDGRVSDTGTYDEILARNSGFREMALARQTQG